VHQALNSHYLFLLLLGSVGMLAGLYIFFRRWHELRLVQDTPTARIRSAPQGYVKLVGRARAPGKALRAPLSGRHCVWWHYKVEQRRNGSLDYLRWLQCDSGTSDAPFLLADEDAQCMIDPDGAEVEPSERKTWTGTSGLAPPRSLLGGAPFSLDENYRYTEALVLENAELSVLGELRADTGSITNTFDDEAAALLGRWKQDQRSLLARFDADHDGRIDAAEWDAARAAALAQARQNMLHQPPEQRINRLVRPHGGQPFVIAARSAEQLARLEGWRALSGLALTVVSVIVTSYAIAHV
jgi:E3 Ubiquitin ligase